MYVIRQPGGYGVSQRYTRRRVPRAARAAIELADRSSFWIRSAALREPPRDSEQGIEEDRGRNFWMI